MNALQHHKHWFLRLALASVFLYHGIGKFTGAGGIGGFAMMAELAYPIAVAVALAEVAAGIGIIVGGFGNALASRLAGLAVIPVMLGAIAMIHWPRWSFTPSESHPMGGMEFQVVLLCIGAYFALGGGDPAKRT